MSKSKTKTSSTQATTSNSTTTPTVAPWLSQGYQDFASQIGQFGQTNPQSYVTGPTANQTAAFNSAGQLGGGNDLIKQGADIATGVTKAPTPSYSAGTAQAASTTQADIDRFLNPYLQNVVDTTLADYDVNSGRVTAAQAAQAAKNQAFGGSRFALREAQTEGELARGRATTDSGLRSSAYDKALANAQMEADRRQQAAMASYGAQNQAGMFNAQQQASSLDRNLGAAGILGNFGSGLDANTRANTGAQLDLGNAERDINNEQAQALPNWLSQLSGLYGSIPIGSFTSLNQQGSGTGQSTGKSSTTGFSAGWSPTSGFSFGG